MDLRTGIALKFIFRYWKMWNSIGIIILINMGKCMSGISVDVYIPQEVSIEMKIIEEEKKKVIKKDLRLLKEKQKEKEDSIESLCSKDYEDIDRVVDELLEDESQSDIEDFIDGLLEENDNLIKIDS